MTLHLQQLARTLKFPADEQEVARVSGLSPKELKAAVFVLVGSRLFGRDDEGWWEYPPPLERPGGAQ